jgi:ubiquitin carboxyl-terminal hydrolase 10
MSIKSPLSDIFGGQLYSVVKAKGNKASATVQPFLVLHLDILPEAVQSLEDALKFFAAPESLEGYKAASSKASEVVSASKAIKIQSLPPVLIVHFMRFSYGVSGSGKLNKAVKYSNTLTIGRELLASSTGLASEGRKYELVATVTHHGKDPSAGHYTADCRQPDGRWLRFDDAVVSVVPINRVLQEQAYVLFYKRVTQ